MWGFQFTTLQITLPRNLVNQLGQLLKSKMSKYFISSYTHMICESSLPLVREKRRVGSYLHTAAKLLLSSVDREMAINSMCQIVKFFFRKN